MKIKIIKPISDRSDFLILVGRIFAVAKTDKFIFWDLDKKVAKIREQYAEHPLETGRAEFII